MLRPLLHITPGGLGNINSSKFKTAYAVVLKNEGGYLFHPKDKGGETYMGIARNYHPTWPGWKIIDQFHENSGIRTRNGGFLPRYEQRQILPLVEQFYSAMWSQSRAEQIQNQSVATLYFDFYIHSRYAVREIQKALNRLGANLVVDNLIGPKTLGAINSADPNKLHDLIKIQRSGYVDQLVSSGQLDIEFYDGIQKRIASFPNLSGSSKNAGSNNLLIWGIGLGLLGIGFHLQGAHYNNKLKLQDYEK